MAQKWNFEQYSIQTLLKEIHDELRRPIPRMSTGFPIFDLFLGGGIVMPSLTVLGAQPKIGKSTWTQQIADHWVSNGGAAWVRDLENGKSLFGRRLIHRRAGVSEEDLKGGLKPEVDKAITKAERHWKKTRGLYVDPGRNMTATAFNLEMRAFREEIGKDRNLLIVIDSLQKLHMNLIDRRSEIDGWLRLFENMREELHCVIFLISELARAQAGKQYKASGTNYKESGDIEYSADLALSFVKTPTGHKLYVEHSRLSKCGLVAHYKPMVNWCGFTESHAK